MKELKSREGYYLTQIAKVGDDRVFVTAIKGANVNEADWREATEAERADWLVAHEQEEDNRVQ